MKLCRYDDDRLGVVIGDLVHDVTEAQTEIRPPRPTPRRATPSSRRCRRGGALEEMADKAPGKPVSSVKLLSPVARPSKIMAAPTNYRQAHRGDAGVRAPDFSPRPVAVLAEHREGRHLSEVELVAGRPSEGIPIRFPDRRNEYEVELVRVIGKQGSDIPKDKAHDYIAGYRSAST